MRVFRVRLFREMDLTIAAESEKELEEALREARYDFDDWNPPTWDWTVTDPLGRCRTMAEVDRIRVEEPDMGVVKGEIRAHEDCDDDLMERIEATVKETQRKIYVEALQVKLPGVG